MSILLRSLLFLFFGALCLVAVPLYAQGPPPLPAPPRPDNAQRQGLAASFSGSGATNSQPTAVAQQDLHFPERLPLPQSVGQASFATHPLPASSIQPASVQHEEFLRENLPEDPYYEEDKDYIDIHYATLERPLASRRLAEFGDEGEESNSGGWQDKIAKPNLTQILSVGSTLLIVIAIFFILAIFLRKVSPQSSRPLPKEAFECLGRYCLTQKHQVQLLRLGNRIILVSVMPDSVNTLAEITDPDEAVTLLGLCRRLDTNSATEMFRKTVAGMSEEEFSRPHQRPAVAAQRRGQSAASFEAYSEPDESLAAILARGRQYGR